MIDITKIPAPMIPTTLIDPVCLFHGLKRSEHFCLYCCLCFKTLELEECHLLPDGMREDICYDCMCHEAYQENHIRTIYTKEEILEKFGHV